MTLEISNCFAEPIWKWYGPQAIGSFILLETLYPSLDDFKLTSQSSRARYLGYLWKLIYQEDKKCYEPFYNMESIHLIN